MLVSTLDGKISALNMDKEGALEWSINTGSNPLLSSSISNLEVGFSHLPYYSKTIRVALSFILFKACHEFVCKHN